MLRTERPAQPSRFPEEGPVSGVRELLLAVAPAPRLAPSVLDGWPNWLAPTFRSGAHRPTIRLLDEDER